MPIPIVFRKPAPQPAVYQNSEIVTGIGWITLYGFNTWDEDTSTTVPEYSLTTQQPRSHDASTSVTSGSANELDFDIGIQRSLIVVGTAIVEVKHLPATGPANVTVKIRKWDGSTETEVASASTDNITSAASVQSQRQVLYLPITKTYFKAGEFIRVSIEVSEDAMVVYHDPVDETGNGDELIIRLPTRLP